MQKKVIFQVSNGATFSKIIQKNNGNHEIHENHENWVWYSVGELNAIELDYFRDLVRIGWKLCFL